jgi:hypothetical protein
VWDFTDCKSICKGKWGAVSSTRNTLALRDRRDRRDDGGAAFSHDGFSQDAAESMNFSHTVTKKTGLSQPSPAPEKLEISLAELRRVGASAAATAPVSSGGLSALPSPFSGARVALRRGAAAESESIWGRDVIGEHRINPPRDTNLTDGFCLQRWNPKGAKATCDVTQDNWCANVGGCDMLCVGPGSNEIRSLLNAGHAGAIARYFDNATSPTATIAGAVTGKSCLAGQLTAGERAGEGILGIVGGAGAFLLLGVLLCFLRRHWDGDRCRSFRGQPTRLQEAEMSTLGARAAAPVDVHPAYRQPQPYHVSGSV